MELLSLISQNILLLILCSSINNRSIEMLELLFKKNILFNFVN